MQKIDEVDGDILVDMIKAGFIEHHDCGWVEKRSNEDFCCYRSYLKAGSIRLFSEVDISTEILKQEDIHAIQAIRFNTLIKDFNERIKSGKFQIFKSGNSYVAKNVMILCGRKVYV